MSEFTKEHIGKYEIIREIGRGATSHVYLAKDPFANREVAIKVFSFDDALEQSQEIEMQRKGFLTEAALVGHLSHPHIVQIYDAATTEGKSYIVMEYIEGVALDQHANVQTLLPISKVVEIIFKCARALDMAMREGIIHRDLKPGNIMLTKNGGDIKITDFGAAIRVANHLDNTRPMGAHEESMVGSPGYMSPEQVRNETLTHQSDIFSLGVVMYRLLTGRLPLIANNQMGMAYAILNTIPQAPSSLRPNLPQILDHITMKAMAKDRNDRYRNWGDFGKDLTTAFSSLRTEGDEISDSSQFEALQTLPFFGDFDDVELWEIVRICQWRECQEGELIIKEGDDSESVFILVDGEARVSLREQILSTLKRGTLFGEMLYFSDEALPRETSVTANTECDVIEIKANALKNASERLQNQWDKAALRVLIERLGQMHKRMAILRAGQQDK